ncbi:unnamed protein product [Rotaria socialis]|uniref:Fibronectin type-III domain-containing protein n=3 Tax=Rotaria socialis TaxID=392032 RepID=A0A820K6W6_9BILA|nr:unnamed protein product [Rotaria socialis]
MEFKMSLTGKVIGHLISINDSLTRAIKIEDSLKTEFIFNNLSPANALFIIYDYILIIVLEHQFEFNGMHLNPFEQDNVFFIIFTTNHSSISYILNNLDGYTNYSCSISASSGCSNYCQSSIFMTEESDLDTTTPYAFILCAKARMGCGEASINRLLTTENRNRPVAQYPPTISESSITSTSLILTWRKSYDEINKLDGQITKLFIQNLKPNTTYRFRLSLQNDMGIRTYSPMINYTRTKESVRLTQPQIDYIPMIEPCQINIYLKLNL